MDEKTAELRDIFIEATGSDTVTENQEESPGSLSERGERVDERLLELVGRMRERYEFASGLDDESLREVVRGYYEGRSDEELAAALDADEEEIFDARMDLHLVRETDEDAPFDLDDLRSMAATDVPMDERVEQLSADEDTVRHYAEVVEARRESTRANDRYRDEFRDLLTDSDIEGRLARDAREDGLREATEDLEVDTAF